MRAHTAALALLALCACCTAVGAAAGGGRRLAQAVGPGAKNATKPAPTTATTKPAAAPGGKYNRHDGSFCSQCGTEDEPVCGTDQQTYLNECIMNCAAAIKLKVRASPLAG